MTDSDGPGLVRNETEVAARGRAARTPFLLIAMVAIAVAVLVGLIYLIAGAVAGFDG